MYLWHLLQRRCKVKGLWCSNLSQMSQPIQLCLLFFDVYLFLYLGRLSMGYCSHDVGGSEIYVWCPHHWWLVSEFSGILEIEHSSCVSLFLFWSEFLYFMCWYLQNVQKQNHYNADLVQNIDHIMSFSLKRKRKTCLFIVWNPHWVQQTLQFTPLVLELFLMQSHLLWGEFSICALCCCSYSQSLQFSFLVSPGTHHCWVDRGSVIWEACPTPLHMTGHVLPLCESCSRTTLPCLQYPTSSSVYPCPLGQRHMRWHFSAVAGKRTPGSCVTAK